MLSDDKNNEVAEPMQYQGQAQNQAMELISNVLVLDGNEEAFGVLKVFCQENHLVGFRASTESVNELL